MLGFFFRMMWAAGAVAAMSSITFPAISAIVSRNADPDQQGKLPAKTICISWRWLDKNKCKIKLIYE